MARLLIGTPANTGLSAVLFVKTGDHLDDFSERLKALRHFAPQIKQHLLVRAGDCRLNKHHGCQGENFSILALHSMCQKLMPRELP